MKLHKHEPVFDEYYRTFGVNVLYYRVALFHCAVTGCTSRGQQEEWPQEDEKVIWIDRKEDSGSRL